MPARSSRWRAVSRGTGGDAAVWRRGAGDAGLRRAAVPAGGRFAEAEADLPADLPGERPRPLGAAARDAAEVLGAAPALLPPA